MSAEPDADVLNLLLIEDNDDDAELVAQYVGELGGGEFALARAADLAEGCRLVESSDFDLVLLDLHLPDSTGLATLRRVCDLCQDDGPLVVVLTGVEDQETVREALRSCAQDYLLKSEITPTSLLHAIRVAVQKHGSRRLAELNRLPGAAPDVGAAARQVLRRANRVAAATHRPPGQQAYLPPLEAQDLVTASQATELIFAELHLKLDRLLNQQRETRADVGGLSVQMRQLEKDNREAVVSRERHAAAIRGLRKQIRPLAVLVDGNGKPPLAVRLDTIEASHRRWNAAHKARTKTVREIVVGLAPNVLMAMGTAIAGFLVWYLTNKMPAGH